MKNLDGTITEERKRDVNRNLAIRVHASDAAERMIEESIKSSDFLRKHLDKAAFTEGDQMRAAVIKKLLEWGFTEEDLGINREAA